MLAPSGDGSLPQVGTVSLRLPAAHRSLGLGCTNVVGVGSPAIGVQLVACEKARHGAGATALHRQHATLKWCGNALRAELT